MERRKASSVGVELAAVGGVCTQPTCHPAISVTLQVWGCSILFMVCQRQTGKPRVLLS